MNRCLAFGSAFFVLLFSALHCRHYAIRNPVGRAEAVFSGSHYTETGTERKMESGADSLGPFDVTVHGFKDAEGKYAVSLQKQTWRESNISVYSWIHDPALVVNAEAYLGLSVDGLPDYEKGICSYILDRSQFAYPLVVDDLNEANIEQAVFFLWKTADGRYAAAVPLGGDGFRNVLRIQHGKLEAIGRSNVDAAKPKKVPLLAVGTSRDPYSLVSDIMKFSVQAMGLRGGLRSGKTFPRLFEKFGWCTWNALGRYRGSLGEKITAGDLYAAAKSFQNESFAMPWMLIDDGWQMVANRKMTGFDAVKSKFPKGLAGTVQILKRQYGVPRVGVWHAVAGYWDGIHPDSPAGRRYPDALMSNRFCLFPTAASAKGSKWYADWYDHLKASGIDFLKVDNQGAILNLIRGAVPLWDGAARMQANMQGEIRRVFDGAVDVDGLRSPDPA